MSRNTRIIILSILGVCILAVASFGLTYAFMRPAYQSENTTDVEIKACAKVVFNETSNTTINLQNTYPMDDNVALEYTPYEFEVSTNCDATNLGFYVYLTSLTSNDLDDANIDYAIADSTGSILLKGKLTAATNGTSDFNTEELNQLDKGIKGTHKSIYKIYTGTSLTKTATKYKLYLWVDKLVEATNTMNKTFKAGLSVKAYTK